MQKQIKDPVHGYIEVPEKLLPLLDTPEMQRLRYIKQLGFSYLVYPGANHTRFEHSLGAMHLASLACHQTKLSEDETLAVCAAALLHDIGHGPYSHASERVMKSYGNFSHDNIRELLSGDEISSVLEKNSLDKNLIAKLVSGDHPLAPIIHGDLDVDRMDYLLRDAHYTGVPYGMVDCERLIHSLAFLDDEFVIHESGIFAAESLLIARTLMGPSVYYHHVGRIAESMFLLASLSHFASAPNDKSSFIRMDDSTATNLLLNSPSENSRELMNLILKRRLYKRAVYAGRNTADPERMTQMTSYEVSRAQKSIAEMANVPEHQVILDIPPLRKEIRMQVLIQSRHDVVSFEEVMPMLKIMNVARQGQWRVGVYTVDEHREKVAEAAREVLGLSRATKQNKLTDLI